MFEGAGRRNDPVVAGSVDAAGTIAGAGRDAVTAAVDYGYVVPLEPGAIDPVRFREVAAARAARAGMVPVVDPASGQLVWIDVGCEMDEFATDCLAGSGWGGDGATMPTGPWEAPDWDGRPPVEVPPHVMDLSAVMGSPIVVPPVCEEIAPAEAQPFGVASGGRAAVGGLSAEHVAAAADEPGVRVPARAPGLAGMPGGAGLAGAVAGVDVSAVGAYELVEHIAACERVASAMHALQAAGVAELAKRSQMRPLVRRRRLRCRQSG